MGLNFPPASMSVPPAGVGFNAPVAAPVNTVAAPQANPFAPAPVNAVAGLQQPGVVQPGVVGQPGLPQPTPQDLQMMQAMVFSALQQLLQPPPPPEPDVFDIARQMNQSGNLRLNPLGKEVLKNKTDDNTGYFEALGYLDEEV